LTLVRSEPRRIYPKAFAAPPALQDLCDVATEEDAAQLWEEARAIASRILAACPTT
jgi:hypothetical protein